MELSIYIVSVQSFSTVYFSANATTYQGDQYIFIESDIAFTHKPLN